MKFAASLLCLFLCACTTTPDGDSRLSPEGQLALETSVRIAVRHAVADSPRALEKAQNIRQIVVRLQGIVSADSTLGALEAVVQEEITKLNLSPVDEADARDLVALFGAALEARLGEQKLSSEGWVRVNDFLSLVLSALPAE